MRSGVPLPARHPEGGARHGLTLRKVGRQLAAHAPFTALGTASGIALVLFLTLLRVPAAISEVAFWILHPSHVLLSAYVTTVMYRSAGRRQWWLLLLVGWVGSVGIATLSDSVIPFLGELLLSLPSRHIHVGFVEKWWLVNPLALAGIALAFVGKSTRFPHAAHVLLSTWASLFHITMAVWNPLRVIDYLAITAFLFLSVWVPCCTSDIVFPLLLAGTPTPPRGAKTGR